MESDFPLAPPIAQMKICRCILQQYIGHFQMNSMHPSNVSILQEFMGILTWVEVGKLEGFMIGRRDELLLNQ